MKYYFMVIDDSELDCFIAEKMIRHTVSDSEITSFIDASKALENIALSPVKDRKTIVLLDILMPVMDGFAFMDVFERLPQALQNNFLIVGLTSSMNKKDLSRITEYPAMTRLLDKPLTSQSVIQMLKEIEARKVKK